MLEKIYLQIIKLLGKNPSGLLPLKEDERDFKIGSIWDFFGGYTPKQEVKEIKTISVKDQKRLSNCSFQAATVQKEIDEDVILSARYLTAKAYQQGLCGRGGWADMRSGQIVLNNWGCCKEKDCPSNSNLSWNDYVNINFTKLDPLAEEHKTKTYWKIQNVDELLKAVDEGHAVTVGIPWYSGFNQGGGFKSPWIIRQAVGYLVSGHALCSIGYKPELVTVQNSYSANWGDKGKLYITRAFLNIYIRKYGAYANLDVEYDKILTGEDLIEKYDWVKNKGMNVKGDRSGAIYLIYDGYKYAYKNARAFVAYNGKPYNYKDMFVVVPQKAIDGVPSRRGAEVLDGQGGDYWEVAQNLRQPVNDNFNKEK